MTVQTVQYVKIGDRNQFPILFGRQVRAGRWDIAVFRTSDDKLFALENRTAHKKGGTLVEGIVSGHYIYCPMRDLKIDLRSGEVQEPDDGQVRTFPIRMIGEQVEIGLPVEG